MARKGILTLICLLGIPLAGMAVDNHASQTLDSLIGVALEANPDIRAAQFDLAAAEYGARTAGSLPDPQLSAGALNLPRTSLSLGETPMSAFSIGLSQAIPWPGKLRARGAIARLQARATAQSAS
ncbi:MAG: TolC family protein, partial [candidate division Zixibacteria bacterium]|nr:TolC family protein [candidate division Zixibacteria bacterium]